MSYSLQLQGGDLSVTGSECNIVYGTSKLVQDMEIWLLTRYGSDRMHPTFGSTLQSFIGQPMTSPTTTQTNVYNEILRVLNNYQSMVYASFQGNPNNFSLEELPYSIDSISPTVTFDTLYCTVQVSNPSSTATVTISPSSL